MLKIKNIPDYANENVVMFHITIFINFLGFLVMLGGLFLGFSELQMLIFNLITYFIIAAFTVWQNEKEELWERKNITVNLSVIFIATLAFYLPNLPIFWLYQQTNFLTTFLTLFNSFLVLALLAVSGRGSVWVWIYWIILSLILAVNTFFINVLAVFVWLIFGILFVLNLLIRQHLGTYALLAKKIRLEFWLGKKLALADLIFCFKKQKQPVVDFVKWYFKNSFESYPNDYYKTNIFAAKKPLEAGREAAFWWLIGHFEGDLWERKDFLFNAILLYNRDFIRKWQSLALTQPLAKIKLDNFLSSSQDSFGNFIATPHYEIAFILKRSNLEEKFAQMVAEVGDEDENLLLVYNLLYISAGLAAQVEPIQNYKTDEDDEEDESEWDAWL